MEKSRTYASQELQDAFLALPESDQDALVAIHEAKAHAINDIIQSAGVSSLTEAFPYFELAGYRIEKQNRGAPRCPDIALNEKEASQTKPQAWSYLIDENAVSHDWRYSGFELWKRIFPWHKDMSEKEASSKRLYPTTLWMYNYPGACAESKYLFPEIVKTDDDVRRVIPDIDVWMEMLTSISGNNEQKVQVLNIPVIGYRNANTNELCDMDYAYIPSSSSGNWGTDCVIMMSSDDEVKKNYRFHEHGLPLRFFWKGKQTT